MRTLGLPLLAATLLLASCDSGTAPTAEVPGGVSVTLNGVVVVRAVGSTAEGAIHIHFGETSGLFEVDVLDGRGAVMSVDPDLRLEASVGDPGLAAFVQSTPGAFRGEFVMYGEGATTITFRLARAGSGTVEWSSAPVELLVIAC